MLEGNLLAFFLRIEIITRSSFPISEQKISLLKLSGIEDI